MMTEDVKMEAKEVKTEVKTETLVESDEEDPDREYAAPSEAEPVTSTNEAAEAPEVPVKGKKKVVKKP